MIDVEHWKRLSTLIDEAFAIDDQAAREAWLAGLDTREPELAPKVRRALAEESSAAEDTRAMARQTGFGPLLGVALRETARPPSSADLAGRRFGAWRLVAPLGVGGMGQVWRARRDDGLFQGEAAIKLLRGDLGSTAMAARFARERALLARLSHPAIARLLDAGIAGAEAGEAAGQAYLVLELVRGDALNTHVRRAAPTLAQRVRLLASVAEAVEYAHARLVVHRDLKPSNVIVDAEGQAKLLDFGIAALLEADDALWEGGEITRITGRGLTPAYAAPEQITGAPIGTAADVFSLGVMLYELATGCLPFGPRSGTRTALEHAVLHDEPRRLSQLLADEDEPKDPLGPGRPVDAAQARGDLEAIAAKALRKDPAERYAGVRALVEDLHAWLDHRPVQARRGSWQHHAALWLRRHALLATAGALVLVSLGAGLGASLWQRSLALQAAQRSDEVTAYLEELLASASPDNHGGSWPTVLQLLERSRADLPRRFAESPDTRLRVQLVLLQVYRELNRLDVAVPLGEEQLKQSVARYGEGDARTLHARFEFAQSLQLAGQCDRSIPVLEPGIAPVRRLPRDQADDLPLMWVALLAICNARLGRLDAAERWLAEEQRLVAPLPADSLWHSGVHHHVHVLRLAQGRPRAALDAIRRTEPFWQSTAPGHQRELLAMQRNFVALQAQLGEYEGLEARFEALLERVDRTLGAGNQLGQRLRLDQARLRLDLGDGADALRRATRALELAQQAGNTSAASLLPLRAQVLALRAVAGAAPATALLAEARTLAAEADVMAAQLGAQRAEIALALARTALAADEAELAGALLAKLDADPSLRLAPGPTQDRRLGVRKEQLDGQLARLRGDFDASRRELMARLEWLDRGDAPRRHLEGWAAALDLAHTAVRAGSPEALLLLADAATRRPAALPPDHPLDAATRYLQARQQAGRDDAPEVQSALAALRAAQQRGQAAPPAVTGLKGNLGGVLY